jgi:hypothetical protein
MAENSSNEICPSPFSSTCLMISLTASSLMVLPNPRISLISSLEMKPLPSYTEVFKDDEQAYLVEHFECLLEFLVGEEVLLIHGGNNEL